MKHLHKRLQLLNDVDDMISKKMDILGNNLMTH